MIDQEKDPKLPEPQVSWPKIYAIVLAFMALFCLAMYLFTKYTT